MDRRTILALILTAIVIVATPLLFPAARAPQRAADTTKAVAPAHSASDTTPSVAPAAGSPAGGPTRVAAARPAPVRPETTVVRTNRAVYELVSPGGVPAQVVLPDYKSLSRGASRADRVALVATGDRLLSLRIARGRDTLALDTVAFSSSGARRLGSEVVVTLRSVSLPKPVAITYRFPVDSFAFSVEGTADDSAGALAVVLPTRIRSQEADTIDDRRHLAFGYKRGTRDAESITFRDLDPGTIRVDTGAFHWVAERNKYFVVAALGASSGNTFRSVVFRGGERAGKDAITAFATTSLPLSQGRFAFRVYAGPQAWEELRRAAPDLENVNAYGGWLPHSVVQPFTTLVVRLLLWMRRTFHVEYGWVLIMLGVFVRLLLWPLSQKSMRASMQMQRLQPELQEIQKRYRNDPQRQQEAMMKVYRDNNMSPLSPLLGCLPMLLPMPILLALYFVFANTIELRGVSFLWLPDLSLRDPYFITPLFMGASMFAMSWLGMRGVPPNPQSKMMSYVMPVMFTMIFWNFASGLNLYYAVQNIAALPQQWLLGRERVAQQTSNRPDGPRGRG